MSRLGRGAISIGLTFILGACTVRTGGQSVEADLPDRSENIVIGAFNFSESQVLAEVYEHVLDKAGYEADVLADIGPREIVQPALEQGQVDLAVEYMGAALAFLDPDSSSALSQRETFNALRSELLERDLEPLDPAPGQNRNEFVVSAETARTHDLASISDLQSIDGDLTFGGPPECPARPLCLEGLERLYQLDFGGFTALDTGGPLTSGALVNGDIDVGLLFTTNPDLAGFELVPLEDDRGLQPPENIVPIVRSAILDDHGTGLEEAVNSVSALLTNDELRRLNAAVDLEHQSPHEAAQEWLGEKDLL
jgi:osmoprotectant transport system substrate-binding protein